MKAHTAWELRTACAILVALTITAMTQATDRNAPNQYATIQSAINACVNGDTTLIEAKK
jgi:hypothetical protein